MIYYESIYFILNLYQVQVLNLLIFFLRLLLKLCCVNRAYSEALTKSLILY